jgi:hypothetical protein
MPTTAEEEHNRGLLRLGVRLSENPKLQLGGADLSVGLDAGVLECGGIGRPSEQRGGKKAKQQADHWNCFLALSRKKTTRTRCREPAAPDQQAT